MLISSMYSTVCYCKFVENNLDSLSRRTYGGKADKIYNRNKNILFQYDFFSVRVKKAGRLGEAVLTCTHDLCFKQK